MSTGAGTPGEALCARPGCGRSVGVQTTTWRQRRLYCQPECRQKARTERLQAKKAPYVPASYQRTCQCPTCGKAFTSKSCDAKFCSHACASKLRAEQERERRRDAAARTALRRSRRERCPECGAALGADLTLLYCSERCGWSDLLTAHPRTTKETTPMAKDTSPKPETTDEEEEEEEELEEDEDEELEEEEEDEEPEEDEGSSAPARKARRKPARVRPRGEGLKDAYDALKAGGPMRPLDLARALGLADKSGSGTAMRLVKKGLARKLPDGRYEAIEPKAKAAPTPEPKAAPKPRAPKAAPAEAPAEPRQRPSFTTVLRLIRELPTGQRELLLGELAPAVAAWSAAQVAQRVLEEELQKLGGAGS